MSASMRYGAYAMEVLINQILKAGARRENLEAKVFGGGNVLRGFTSINVGERNARFVREFLHAENIRIVAGKKYTLRGWSPIRSCDTTLMCSVCR